MSKSTVMIPKVSHPKTRAGGKDYTEDDKEFHELEKLGGVREYKYLPYPAMRYKAEWDYSQAKVVVRDRIVESSREDDAAQAEGWTKGPDLALAAHEAREQEVARVAAEVAHTAETKMSDPAKREYRKRSASTDEHITE